MCRSEGTEGAIKEAAGKLVLKLPLMDRGEAGGALGGGSTCSAMTAPLSGSENSIRGGHHRARHPWKETRRAQIPWGVFTLQDFLSSAGGRLSVEG